MSNDELEQSITEYCSQLAAQADLAERDLEEIEDHLRALTSELREHGMPVADAVTEAARRLGKPRDVAREQARVRTAFGTRLPSARAWSVALLVVPLLALELYYVLPIVGLWSGYTLRCAVSLGLVIALVSRVSWARSVLLGGVAFGAIPQVVGFIVSPYTHWLMFVFLGAHLATVAFLLPWRRHELTVAGASVALAGWACSAASTVLGFELVLVDIRDLSAFAPVALLACVSAAVTSTGGILRARWSAVSFAVTALLLALAAGDLADLTLMSEQTSLLHTWIVGMTASAVCMSLVGAVLAWRSARSLLGSLRSVAA